ncbi:MAG: hypothetical protein AAFX06_18805 [Planctomycetota bacterium]
MSFGINHLYADLFRQEYNSAAWKTRLSVEYLKGAEFKPALRKWFLKTCDEYGFNTVGVHNDLSIVNRPKPTMAYTQPFKVLEIPHWRSNVVDENFRDVFSNEFESLCDETAQRIAAPVASDPFLIGYTMTDCPLFTEEDCRERPDVIGGARRPARIGFPRRLRNLGADAPGKQAYVRLMRQLYHDSIADFNRTYDTDFDSFDALARAKDWRAETQLSNSSETRDNVEFVKRVVARYYETAKNAIRRYDPNHLFIGDKLNANTDSLETVLPVTSQYTDVLFYQMYARYEVQKPGLHRWARRVDLPVINGDSAFTMITDTMPRPYGPVADTLQQRADWTVEFFENAFARPEFVGWHYCGLIDAPNLIARKRDRQHSGLLDGYGRPYESLQSALKAASSRLYAFGNQVAG